MFDALPKLGLGESILSGLSLLKVRIARIFKKREEITFEDWVVNRFGRRLFNHFFKSYSEKLWGISVKELGSDWAAQRLKDMSLWEMIKSLVWKPKRGKIKSMIDEFHYPKFGPGQLYEKVAQKIEELGGKVKLGVKVIEVVNNGDRVEKIIVKNKDGITEEIMADEFITSAPLNELLKMFRPLPSENVLKLVEKMRFRAFFDVCLIVDRKNVFEDNWIYVHEPEVQLLRVQNFKNWSPFMAADINKTPIGAEYVCWETDKIWQMNQEELIKLAAEELEKASLLPSNLASEGTVMRNNVAYPVYHLDYKEDLKIIFDYLKQFKNLQTIGRAGLYRYNNMDHSILTGFYAARNVLGENYNVLDVNADDEFHELGKA
jgi:protoporphyrinogen oxidase